MIKDDLNWIVVKIAPDKEMEPATGFFISEDEVATCYHVLARGEPVLRDVYYIRQGTWEKWKIATPIKEKCNRQMDCAILRCEEKIQYLPDLSFDKWNRNFRKFDSYGYGRDTDKVASKAEFYSIDGIIKGITNVEMQPRLQLQLKSGTVYFGRSGSPVLSGNAIVGIMAEGAGRVDDLTQMVFAVPIEYVVPEKFDKSIFGDKIEKILNLISDDVPPTTQSSRRVLSPL
jgi:hypothetical protein